MTGPAAVAPSPFPSGFRGYAGPRFWRELAHVLLDLPVAVVLFSLVVTGLSLSIGMLITLLGLPLLVATIHGGRLVALVEVARARALLAADLPRHPPLDLSGDWLGKAKALLLDGAGWKGLAYGLLLFPWSVVTFLLVVLTASLGLACAAAPALLWLPRPTDAGLEFGGWDRAGWSLGLLLVGGLLLFWLPLLVGALAEVDRVLVRLLLTPSRRAALARRVTELQESRDASVESSAAELRRIERDLHDGAQQRLVSLAMHTGLAKERLRDSGDERALEMVTLAHDEAKQAIAELRDLVRGIHPAVLTDRGLDAAVSALVARCPVPVTVESDLHRRLPPAVEGAAYFVIAEALTNIAKHSGARTARIQLLDRGEHLVLQIDDDGTGGATTDDGGGGLRGLQDRVVGMEGRLRIASPAGGPTSITVELPCAS